MYLPLDGRPTVDPVCQATPDIRPHAPQRRARVTLPLADLMRGGGDAITVERALGGVLGVVHAYVNPSTEMAYIEYDPERTGVDRLKRAVQSAGRPPGERQGEESTWKR